VAAALSVSGRSTRERYFRLHCNAATFRSSVFKLLSGKTCSGEIIAARVGELGKRLPREARVKRCLNSPKTVILNEMVITDPVEQLRGCRAPRSPGSRTNLLQEPAPGTPTGGGAKRGGGGGGGKEEMDIYTVGRISW